MSIYDKSSLVLIPSGTKTGKVYSQKPVSGDGDFTFTRSSAATRVNADGFIEKETQNLLKQSNTFDTTPWGGVNASVTPNATTAPDGTLTASKIVATAVNAQHRVDQGTTSSSGVKTFSVYLKQAEITDAWLRIGTSGCFIDLTDGSLSSVSPNIIASVEALANDWYRCSITKTDASANEIVRINAGVTDYLGDDVIGVFVWRAQYEEGLVARDYIETTTTAVEVGITDNVPRLDYTDSSCPALLLEPQRNNLLVNSEYLGGFTYSSATIESNTSDTISPEGVYNASKITNTAAAGYIYPNYGISVTAEKDYTFSFYAKDGGLGTPELAVYDLSNGAFISVDVPYSVSTSEWKRITHTFETPVGCTSVRVYPIRGGGAGDIYFYGLQLEDNGAGGGSPYATSYIPTYGSSVTRVLETCQVEDEGALINSEQGALYFEGIAIDPSYASVMSFSDGTLSNRICLTLPQNATNINAFSSIGGSKIDNNILHDPSVNSKYAIVWNGNSFKVFVNGVKKVDNTMAGSFSANTLTDIRFDRGDGALNFEGFCKSYLSIASALTDQEAIDLTTI